MKVYYRGDMHTVVLENMEGTEQPCTNVLPKDTNLFQALHLLTMLWDRVSEKTIKNCFSRGGFVKADEGMDVMEFNNTVLIPFNMTEIVLAEWMSTDENAKLLQQRLIKVYAELLFLLKLIILQSDDKIKTLFRIL